MIISPHATVTSVTQDRTGRLTTSTATHPEASKARSLDKAPLHKPQ